VPYIPGSSLKGKIRCLLEQINGVSAVGGSSKVNELFGYSDDNIPSKLIVRDAYLIDLDENRLRESEYTDLPYTEIKTENTIDRIKGSSKSGLRKTERIPAGVSFDVNFVINVWDTDQDGEQSKALLFKGIEALENDYLGGSGSRGYGQVKFSEPQVEEVAFNAYFK
jgi:CRISPR-associated protein Csm3